MYRAVAFCFAVLLGLAALPASAQPIPPGSYQQSCNNIRVRGGQLIASCSASNGGRVQSSTSLDCRGDIGNVNGSLRCNGGGGRGGHGGGMGGGFGGRVPDGSYRQSCRNVQISGSVLSADCSAANGRRVTSSLNLARCGGGGDIGNRDGRLHCSRRDR